MQLIPIPNRELPKEGIYNCPLYKVVSRAGTLSTTGHSTNFVCFIEYPSKESEDIWIRAGVAAFLSLRY
jgi:dynein heavy chain